MEYDDFVAQIKILFTKFNEENKYEFALIVTEIDLDDRSIETSVFCYGCPACNIEVAHSLIGLGDIQHTEKKKETRY